MTRTVLRAATLLAATAVVLPPARAETPPAREPDSKVTTQGKQDGALLKEVLEAHNRERAKEKLPPLEADPALAKAAQAHADDMAAHHKMSHEGSDGSTPFDRLKRQGYHYQSAAENVAEGYRTADDVMAGWMDSPPHRANILGKFSRAGFAVARDDKGYPYWAAEFATPWPKLDPARAGADLVDAVNAARAGEKQPPLIADPKLGRAAGRIAQALAKAATLDASKATDAGLAENLKREGYRFLSVAESAATGAPSAAEAVAGWMGDESTRKGLLAKAAEAGGGYAVDDSGRPYWCLIVATPARR